MGAGVLAGTRRENRPSSRAAAQPTTSLWSSLRQRATANAGSSGVLVELALPAIRGRGAPARRPAITGTVPCSARAIDLASLSSSPSGPHSATSASASAAAASISSRTDGAAPPAPPPPERRHERVADRRPRLEAAGDRDRPATPSRARALGQRAAGRGHQPRRARADRVVVGRQRLLGVARVARGKTSVDGPAQPGSA